MSDVMDASAGVDPYQFPYATSYEARMILMPLAIGWIFQACLASIATDRGARLFRKRAAVKALRSVPFGAPLLLVALILNGSAAACNVAELVIWMCSQQRSVIGLNLFTMADVIAPCLTGGAAVTSQAFMILRCYKILRSGGIYFAIPMFVLLAAALGGAIWISVAASDLQVGDSDNTWIYYATQLWLGSSLLIDIGVTVALTLHLRKLRQGFSKKTDSYVNSLIRITFESFCAPTLINLVATCVYASTFQNYLLWNWSLLASSSIPSLYLLSFVYAVEGTYKHSLEVSSRREVSSQIGNSTRAIKDKGSVRISVGEMYGPVAMQSPQRPAPAGFFSLHRPRRILQGSNAIEITSVATSSWDAPTALDSSMYVSPMSNRSSLKSFTVVKPDVDPAADENV